MTTTWIGIEYAKLRRLRFGLLAVIVLAASVLFSSANLFSRTDRQRFSDPSTQPWEQYLIGYVMTTALIWPILVAILASRVVDIEHLGNGWRLASVLGVRPGRLCRIKWLTLAPLLVILRAVEAALVIAAPMALGLGTPTNVAAWLGFWVGSSGTSLALLAAHIWLSARIEGQLVGLGIGVLGGFIGAFSMLMPAWLALLTPWGYYAALCPYSYGGDARIVPIAPLVVPWIVYCLVMTAVFGYLTHRLDREY